MRAVAPAAGRPGDLVTSRRVFLASLAGGLFAGSGIAQAQQTGKVYRIGYLSPTSPPVASRFTEAFRQGLRELGWVEGQNIAFRRRGAATAPEERRDMQICISRCRILGRWRLDEAVSPNIRGAGLPITCWRTGSHHGDDNVIQVSDVVPRTGHVNALSRGK